jgi:hypothetical protein
LVVCAEDTSATAVDFGFAYGEVQVLKADSKDTSGLGPGNFQLIVLEDSEACPSDVGGDCVRKNLAGDFDQCVSKQNEVLTETGDKVGPVLGLNTRFGDHSGPNNKLDQEDYPPDVVTDAPDPLLELWDDPDTPDIEEQYIAQEVESGYRVITPDNLDLIYDWTDYQNDVASRNFDHDLPPVGYGAFDRRVLAVPVANCTGAENGRTNLPILGFGCYFMIQPVKDPGGGEGNQSIIFGQFVEGCTAGGVPGPAPGPGKGPYVIQLYKNPGSGDS